MHWINFPLLALMIWSGLMIYWADSDAANLHPHQVYRIGIGHWTLFRFFPNAFYDKLGLTFSLAKGLSWHFFLMWLFGINGLLYVLYTFISGAWRDLLPGRHALRDAWHVLLHDLHLRRELPSQGKYNAAQQIAYTLIILAGAGSILTGLAIYKPTQWHWLTSLLGGIRVRALSPLLADHGLRRLRHPRRGGRLRGLEQLPQHGRRLRAGAWYWRRQPGGTPVSDDPQSLFGTDLIPRGRIRTTSFANRRNDVRAAAFSWVPLGRLASTAHSIGR